LLAQRLNAPYKALVATVAAHEEVTFFSLKDVHAVDRVFMIVEVCDSVTIDMLNV